MSRGLCAWMSVVMTLSWVSCLFMSRCIQSPGKPSHPGNPSAGIGKEILALCDLGRARIGLCSWPGRGWTMEAARAAVAQPGRCQPGGAHSNSFGTPGALSHARCQGRVLQEPACLGNSCSKATPHFCIAGG